MLLVAASEFWREEAVSALGRMGKDATPALPLLRRIPRELESERWLRKAVREAIARIEGDK
jgi:hypothetical protein